jgi:hypothetical protein
MILSWTVGKVGISGLSPSVTLVLMFGWHELGAEAGLAF